jgi:hypothetical protein
MLLRVSAKFHRQFSGVIGKGDSPVRPFPQTWNLDLLSHGRSQLLVLASEEHSLFSVLIPSDRCRNLERFQAPFRERLLQLFENIRLWDHPDLNQFTYSGRTDRRIIGSQNDLLYMTRQLLEDSEKPASAETLRGVEEELNSTPMSYLQMDSPMHALRGEMERLTQQCSGRRVRRSVSSPALLARRR